MKTSRMLEAFNLNSAQWHAYFRGYLGNGIVDIDGRHLQLSLLKHLVEVVDTRRRLLGNTLYF